MSEDTEGRIIDFRRQVSCEYGRLLKDTHDFLEGMAQACQEHALDLAMAKAWREWDLQQPPGTELELSPDMLEQCADPRVRELARLEAVVWSVLEQIR
jgi:hypothetical protein